MLEYHSNIREVLMKTTLSLGDREVEINPSMATKKEPRNDIQEMSFDDAQNTFNLVLQEPTQIIVVDKCLFLALVRDTLVNDEIVKGRQLFQIFRDGQPEVATLFAEIEVSIGSSTKTIRVTIDRIDTY